MYICQLYVLLFIFVLSALIPHRVFGHRAGGVNTQRAAQPAWHHGATAARPSQQVCVYERVCVCR